MWCVVCGWACGDGDGRDVYPERDAYGALAGVVDGALRRALEQCWFEDVGWWVWVR